MHEFLIISYMKVYLYLYIVIIMVQIITYVVYLRQILILDHHENPLFLSLNSVHHSVYSPLFYPSLHCLIFLPLQWSYVAMLPHSVLKYITHEMTIYVTQHEKNVLICIKHTYSQYFTYLVFCVNYWSSVNFIRLLLITGQCSKHFTKPGLCIKLLKFII